MYTKCMKEICKEAALKFNLPLNRENDISTGFEKLDEILGKKNLRKSNVIALKSRPGIGLTTIALDFVINIAKSTGEEVMYFAPRSSPDEIFEKLVTKLSGVMLSKIQYNKKSDYDNVKLLSAFQQIYNLNISVCNYADCCIVDIEKALTMSRKPALIVIDDFDEFKTANSKNVLVKIKMLSRRLNIPIIICSSNKKISFEIKKNRQLLINYKENISMFDTIILFYRQPYYEDMEDYDINSAELIVSKNINGYLGVVKLHYNSSTAFVCVD